MELAFFSLGFLFDVVLLHRIDSTPLLIHQGSYLLLAGLLIFFDHRLTVAGTEPVGLWGRVVSHRLWVMHFFLGTLLNAFMVFYFRSSSGLLSFCFLVLLAGLIVGNELPHFRRKGPMVRVMLLSFCVTSFFAYLVPVLMGSLRPWHYPLAAVLGSGATVGLWKLFHRFAHDAGWTFRRAALPGLLLQAALLVFYFLNIIPPVPLSLKHIGIYASVVPTRSEQGLRHELTYQAAPAWRFWRQEDASFVAPLGSRAYAFARIFAPTHFDDSVRFAWEFEDRQRGWVGRGAPYSTSLSGGSEQGYRSYAYTTLSQPGRYRVRVLTSDGREIGRQTFAYVEGALPPLSTRVEEK